MSGGEGRIVVVVMGTGEGDGVGIWGERGEGG